MLSEKDKKLVWDLDEALQKQKDLGKSEETLDSNVKIKNVDPNKEMLVYEYEVKASAFDKAKAATMCKIPKWLIALLSLLGLGALAGIIAALAIKGTSITKYAGYNEECTDSLACDPVKGLTCTNGICACSSLTPLLIDDSYCTLPKSYLDTCSTSQDCDTSKNLECNSGYCKCSSSGVYFWSSVNQQCESCDSTLYTVYNYSSTSYCYRKPSTSACSTDALLSINTQSEIEGLKQFIISNGLTDKSFKVGLSYSASTGWTWRDGRTVTTSWNGWCTIPTSVTTTTVKLTYKTGGSNPCLEPSATFDYTFCEID